MNYHKAWYNKKENKYLQISILPNLEEEYKLLSLEEFLKETDIYKWAYVIGRYGRRHMRKKGYKLVSLKKYFKEETKNEFVSKN